MPTKDWSNSVYSRLQGHEYSADAGVIVAAPDLRLIGESTLASDSQEKANWRVLKETIRSDASFIVMEAQVIGEQRREAQNE